MGLVWAEFVTASIILVATSKKRGYSIEGRWAAKLKGLRDNTVVGRNYSVGYLDMSMCHFVSNDIQCHVMT